MTIINEGLKELYDTMMTTFITTFPGIAFLTSKNKLETWAELFSDLDETLRYLPRWQIAGTPPDRLHSPCGKKEQPGGEVAGIIELINEPLSLEGRGATI